MQLIQQLYNTFSLLWSAGIAWFAMLIQTTLVADANRTAVVRAAMCSYLQQFAVLRDGAILTNVKMVTDGAEDTLLVVTQD